MKSCTNLNTLYKRRLQIFNRKSQGGAGFTLIELLVTFGMVILLTSFLILYNKTGERQLTLAAERSKVLGVITEAKALAVQTFAESNPPCGYGIRVSPSLHQYQLFKNRAIENVCANLKSDTRVFPIYEPGRDVIIETHKLSPGVRFPSGGPEQTILFVPPDPTTVLDPPADGELQIVIETDDEIAKQATITINDFGQITF